MTTLNDPPHLPLLTLDQCIQVFDAAGIPRGSLHLVVGVSRMTAWKWTNGKSAPYQMTQRHVSALAYKFLRSLMLKTMPLTPAPPVALILTYCADLIAKEDKSHPLAKLTFEQLTESLKDKQP